MPDRVRKIRLEERAKTGTRTPHYDMTFSAEKSVSLTFAGLMAATKTARDEGQDGEAKRLESQARSVEAAVMAAADTMIAHVEQHGAIIRTGHHSAHSGEFRVANGFVAPKFLQHTSQPLGRPSVARSGADPEPGGRSGRVVEPDLGQARPECPRSQLAK
jgi:hypothetical protein